MKQVKFQEEPLRQMNTLKRQYFVDSNKNISILGDSNYSKFLDKQTQIEEQLEEKENKLEKERNQSLKNQKQAQQYKQTKKPNLVFLSEEEKDDKYDIEDSCSDDYIGYSQNVIKLPQKEWNQKHHSRIRQNISCIFQCGNCFTDVEDFQVIDVVGNNGQKNGQNKHNLKDKNKNLDSSTDASQGDKKRNKSKKKDQNFIKQEEIPSISLCAHCRICHSETFYFIERQIENLKKEQEKRKNLVDKWEAYIRNYASRKEMGFLPEWSSSVYMRKKQMRKEQQDRQKEEKQEQERIKWGWKKERPQFQQDMKLNLCHKSLLLRQQNPGHSYIILSNNAFEYLQKILSEGKESIQKIHSERIGRFLQNDRINILVNENIPSFSENYNKKLNLREQNEDLQDENRKLMQILKKEYKQIELKEQLENLAPIDEQNLKKDKNGNMFGKPQEEDNKYDYNPDYERALFPKRIDAKQIHERDYYGEVQRALQAEEQELVEKCKFHIKDFLQENDDKDLQYYIRLYYISKKSNKSYVIQKIKEIVDQKVQNKVGDLQKQGINAKFEDQDEDKYKKVLEDIKELKDKQYEEVKESLFHKDWRYRQLEQQEQGKKVKNDFLLDGKERLMKLEQKILKQFDSSDCSDSDSQKSIKSWKKQGEYSEQNKLEQQKQVEKKNKKEKWVYPGLDPDMYNRNKFEQTWKKDLGAVEDLKQKDLRLKKDAENLYWETQKADYEEKVYHKTPYQTKRIEKIDELQGRIEENIQKYGEVVIKSDQKEIVRDFNVSQGLKKMNEVVEERGEFEKEFEQKRKEVQKILFRNQQSEEEEKIKQRQQEQIQKQIKMEEEFFNEEELLSQKNDKQQLQRVYEDLKDFEQILQEDEQDQLFWQPNERKFSSRKPIDRHPEEHEKLQRDKIQQDEIDKKKVQFGEYVETLGEEFDEQEKIKQDLIRKKAQEQLQEIKEIYKNKFPQEKK